MTRGRDRGEANALGLVLIAPVAVALAILILWIGRKVDTDAQVQAASSAAAQAAAHQRNPAAAVAAAQSTATLMLADVTECPGGPVVSTDASQFRPGGEITVEVACSPISSDLLIANPGSATFTASSTASVDAYRAVGLP
ncbi:MAG: pilus assembly protein [Ilumatobacteraceae bacterium]